MRRPHLLTTLLIALSGASCAELPGEEVGTWEIAATLDDSTCGPSVGEQERAFRVQIRRDGEIAYWIGPAQYPIQGRIDEDGNFTFRTNEQILVREGDASTGLQPCVMDQVDVAEGRAAGSLVATETLWVGASSGADCSDQIGLMPGQFITLPCQMSYTLTGELPVSEEPSPR